MKDKAQRRADTERIQKKRIKNAECLWERKLSPKEMGKLKSGNISCGCGMCKPWKHGKDNDMKVSDRKRVKDE